MTSSYEMDTLTHTVCSGLRRNIVWQLSQDSFRRSIRAAYTSARRRNP